MLARKNGKENPIWSWNDSRPIEITHDQGSEFSGHEFRKSLIEDKYGIVSKPNTLGNPMSNAVLEQIHQDIRNLLHTLIFLKPTLTK